MPLLRRAAIISRPAQNNPTTNPTKTQKTTTHKKKVVDSENLMTLFVVVNKFGVKDWEGSYETLCDFIVPRSSRRVAEDNDYALMGVVLFRRVADDFKAAARARGFQVMRACLCGCGCVCVCVCRVAGGAFGGVSVFVAARLRRRAPSLSLSH